MASPSEHPSTPFEAYRDHQDPQLVHLVGELDLATRDRLAEVLTEAARPGRDLIVDCSRLDFIDAAAIAVLLRTARVIGAGRLRLRNPRAGVATLLDLLDLRAAAPNLHRETT